MFTSALLHIRGILLESLDYIKGCIKNRVVPDENKISLKMYCDFFENEIEQKK